VRVPAAAPGVKTGKEEPMLRIRQAQLEALNRPHVTDFENRVLEHVSQFLPDTFSELELDTCLEWIHHGIQRAARHGFTTELHVGLYLDLMFAFGRGFDEDPRHPWAASILGDTSVSADIRINRLYDAGVEHQGQPPRTIAGPSPV
jgi:hypothetical protein